MRGHATRPRRWGLLLCAGALAALGSAAGFAPIDALIMTPRGAGQERVEVALVLPPAGTTQEPAVPASDSVQEGERRDSAPATHASETEPAPSEAPADEPIDSPPATAQAGIDEHLITVARGDSLDIIFQAQRLPQADLALILASDPRAKKQLSRLQPGQQLAISTDANERVSKLTFHAANGSALEVTRGSDGRFSAEWVADADPPAPPKATHPTRASAEPRRQLEAGLRDKGWSQRSVEVANGDSLYTLFLAENLRTSELVDVLRAGDQANMLKRLLPGQRLDFYLDAHGSVRHLVYHLDEIRAVHFHRAGRGFEATPVEAKVERRLATATGRIDSSLFLAAQRAGLEDRLIMEMVEIFAWDVDFALEIRAGDGFALIYEELYKDGAKLTDGAILAAEFTNRGRVIRALRYQDPKGRSEYFSPQGLSMRKAFLRTPVNFTRISSRFGLRKHPVLHKMRRHNGVDYAAPRGTPVKATGDGKVVSIGRNGGYGRTITLRHGATYATLYAHLHRYAKGIKKGKSVRQGQVIGYVGSTGLATGPHLHYEFRVRGAHRDPLKVKLPKAAPIAKQYRAEFLETTRGALAQLELLSRTQLASTE